MIASYADALLAYAMRTAEEEYAGIERAHDLLPEERLEKGHSKWLKEIERRGALLEQRKEEQDSDCSLAIAVEQQPKLTEYSVTNREETQRS